MKTKFSISAVHPSSGDQYKSNRGGSNLTIVSVDGDRIETNFYFNRWITKSDLNNGYTLIQSNVFSDPHSKI